MKTLFAAAGVAFLAPSSSGYGVSSSLLTKSFHASAKKHAYSARARPVRKSSLCMHMGHSHSHHTHEHRDLWDGKEAGGTLLPERTTLRRRVALFAFATLVVLGPPLLRKRGSIGRADAAAFAVTCTVLIMFDGVRRGVKHGINKVRNFRDGIVKHSSPVSPGTLLKYLFRNDSAADRVTLLGGVINILLSSGKFAVGVTCHSSALIADAGHSLSDLFSDFITLWAVQVGRLPPDDDHPYGHGKFEAIGSLFLALTLLATGVSVGAASYRKLIEIIAVQGSQGRTAASLAGQIPTAPALFMAALSIFLKEWLYRVTRQVGERLNSQVVLANAWHHRSDAYSSILALVAIGMAMYFPALIAADATAGILVAGMICMTGTEILGESIKQLTDASNQLLVERVFEIAADSTDVFDVRRVRARQVGSSAMVDVAIATSDDLSSSANRKIEERLRARIMEVPGVMDAEVHTTSKDVPLLITSQSIIAPSTHEIEHDVRALLSTNPDVNSVQAVTVRYANSLTTTNVDVMIRVDENSTVKKANLVAEQLRATIERSDKISKASVFLDLNEEVAVKS